MNEQLSLTMQNNTACYQPVTLFGNTFDIPANQLPSAAGRTYSYDISNESFYFGTLPQTLEVEFSSTTPPPYTSAIPALGSLDAAGVAAALSSVAGDTFTANGSVVSSSLTSNYYRNLSVSPSVIANTNSTLSNIYNILEVYADNVLVYSIASNTGNVTTGVRNIPDGATIDVVFASDIAAISWGISIDIYTDPVTFSNVYSNAGVGFALINVPSFVQSGTIEINAFSI